ncbi:MAG: radical SAM protein [Candidatus Nanopelagicales bacterium]|nr:radical SAM protein [Candidatus Nanopelagicales bacterium]
MSGHAAPAPLEAPVRMGPRTWAALGWFGLTTVLLRRRDPIVGSLIVTDRCNLACAHCAVANLRRTDYPFPVLRADLEAMHRQGVRILFLYGGEPFLWRDGDLRLVDVVAEARRIGYLLVNAVTNGTRGLDLPGADLLLVSVDGTREHHDCIRGRTYDRVLANIAAAPRANLCLYMAVNTLNADDLEHVCRLARDLPTVRAVSFNLHTPYPGTEHLTLDPAARREACARIAALQRTGYPVMNMPSVLPAVAAGTAPRPCRQCVIREDGQQWTCGRCIEIPGLCDQCGFLFAAELSMLFRGDPRVVIDALRKYRAYL